MSKYGWIICERSGRWAAAMRIALARDARGNAARFFEVRSLEELRAQLDGSSHVLALVEVGPDNLAASLAWLADAVPLYPRARFVALLQSAAFSKKDHKDVISSLLAAGVVDVSNSPRKLGHVLQVGQRHAESQASNTRHPGEGQSLAAWAWGLLPWQAAERRIG